MTTEAHRPDDDRDDRTADELLVHALLLDHLRDTPEHSAQRLSRVRESVVPLVRRRRWTLVGTRWSLAAAASLLIALTVLLFLVPQNQALADVEQIIERLAEVDQTYAVELHDESVEPTNRFRSRFRGMGRGARRNAFKWQDGARLYVRGERYVLAFGDPQRPRCTKGFDGHAAWTAGPMRDVPRGRRAVEESSAVEEMLSEVTVDLNELLREMRAGYEVSSPNYLAAAGDLPAMVHYVATPRVLDSNGPARIQLWAEAATGQLDRMICSGLKTRHPRNRYELVVTLLGLDPLPENWFQRRAHVDGE